MRRGFKAWCEKYSSNVRKQLNLKEIASLSPFDLAKFNNILIMSPVQIQGLSDSTKSILLGHSSTYWSAVTISLNGNYLIVYNPTHAEKRQSNNIMHELSHVFLGHKSPQMIYFNDGAIVLRGYDELQEEEADWLAGALLLPRKALEICRRKRIPAQKICDYYKVSSRLLGFRLNVTGINYQFKRQIK